MTSSNAMRIAVFGTGGVGGYFGGRLAQAGHDVAFIARGAHEDAIRQHGLQVESVAGDFVVEPATVAPDPAGVGTVDVILVCVKTWQVPDAARALGPMLGRDTFVVPLQNGVEAADQIALVIGAERVVPGLCRLMSYVAAPGVIRHAAVAPDVEIGERPHRESARVRTLHDAFAGAIGISPRISTDIDASLWTKFLFIASFSGVGALLGLASDAMRADASARAMLEGAMTEIAALASTRGIRLPAGTVAGAMSYVDGLPPGTTASMQRDILEGRPSELEAQNGAVVRLARDASVAVPIHQRIYEALLPAESRARGRAC
ncbi:MAG: 2-dehydropantoate 2-reductase [Acidobacteriota bacterium]